MSAGEAQPGAVAGGTVVDVVDAGRGLTVVAVVNGAAVVVEDGAASLVVVTSATVDAVVMVGS